MKNLGSSAISCFFLPLFVSNPTFDIHRILFLSTATVPKSHWNAKAERVVYCSRSLELQVILISGFMIWHIVQSWKQAGHDGYGLIRTVMHSQTWVKVNALILLNSMTTRRRNPAALNNAKVFVVIPVFNEKDTILEILGRVLATEIPKEVTIVDDDSKDRTRDIPEKWAELQAKDETTGSTQDEASSLNLQELRFFFQSPIQGKGAALWRGFAEATGEIVLVQDADLEYDSRDYAKLLETISLVVHSSLPIQGLG